MDPILSLRAKRGETITQITTLCDKATAEARAMTADEETQYTSLKTQAEGLNSQIIRAEDMERLKAATAQPISDSGRTEIVKDEGDKREPGWAIARVVRSVAGSKKLNVTPWEYCEKYLKDPGIAKAMQANSFANGGALIPEEFSRELIEFLRPASVVRALGAIGLPLPQGNMTVPQQASGASASYIGEGANIAVSQPTFGQLKLTARKLAALTPISNDLIRFGGNSGAVDTLVRNDLVAAIAQAEDLNFLRGDGTAGGPRGLKFWTPAANVITVNATVNLANITVDLGKLWLALANANSRMRNLAYIFAPRTENYLRTLRDGNGNKAFPEMANGTLNGYPFRSTTQIPIDLAVTGTAESEIYLVDMADAIVADVPNIGVDVSDTAAYHNGSAVVAAFSLDQTVIRIIMEHDFGMRHASSVAYLSDVDWV